MKIDHRKKEMEGRKKEGGVKANKETQLWGDIRPSHQMSTLE